MFKVNTKKGADKKIVCCVISLLQFCATLALNGSTLAFYCIEWLDTAPVTICCHFFPTQSAPGQCNAIQCNSTQPALPPPALHCDILHYNILHHIYFRALHYIATSHCIAIYCSIMIYFRPAGHNIALKYIAVSHIALQYLALNCICLHSETERLSLPGFEFHCITLDDVNVIH